MFCTNILKALKNYKDFETYQQLSQTIYKRILIKCINKLPKNVEEIVFLPEGVLTYIPMESLIMQVEEGKRPVFLNDKYRVSYNYSCGMIAFENDHIDESSRSFGCLRSFL